MNENNKNENNGGKVIAIILILILIITIEKRILIVFSPIDFLINFTNRIKNSQISNWNKITKLQS